MRALGWTAALCLAACAALLSGCGPTTLPASGGRDTNLSLRLGDMPAGFAMTAHKRWSNAAAAARDGVPEGLYTGRGRIVSYETTFQQRGLVGILAVDDSVASYRDTAGAHWIYNRIAARMRTELASGKHWLPIPSPAIGDEGKAFSVTANHNGYPYTLQAVLFRRGGYYGYIELGGLAGTFNANQIFRLSHILDERIRSSG